MCEMRSRNDLLLPFPWWQSSFGVVKLFINIELSTRDIWSGNDRKVEESETLLKTELWLLCRHLFSKSCAIPLSYAVGVIYSRQTASGETRTRSQGRGLAERLCLTFFICPFIPRVPEMRRKEIRHRLFKTTVVFEVRVAVGVFLDIGHHSH